MQSEAPQEPRRLSGQTLAGGAGAGQGKRGQGGAWRGIDMSQLYVGTTWTAEPDLFSSLKS